MLSEINQMEKGKYFVSLKCRGYRSQTQRQKVDGGGQGLGVGEVRSSN